MNIHTNTFRLQAARTRADMRTCARKPRQMKWYIPSFHHTQHPLSLTPTSRADAGWLQHTFRKVELLATLTSLFGRTFVSRVEPDIIDSFSSSSSMELGGTCPKQAQACSCQGWCDCRPIEPSSLQRSQAAVCYPHAQKTPALASPSCTTRSYQCIAVYLQLFAVC